MTRRKDGQPRSPVGEQHKSRTGRQVMRHMTVRRKDLFLCELAAHGNVSEAARQASPDSRDRCGAKASFYDERRRDPEFRRVWAEAIEAADARLEVEAVRRACDGVNRPVVQKGRIVRDEDGSPVEITEYSDHLLTLLLRSRVARYQDRRRVEVEHTVAEGGFAVLRAEDLDCLDEDQKRQLHGVLLTIQRHRNEGDDGEGEILDGEFEPVGELPASFDPQVDALSDDERAELAAIIN